MITMVVSVVDMDCVNELKCCTTVLMGLHLWLAHLYPYEHFSITAPSVTYCGECEGPSSKALTTVVC